MIHLYLAPKGRMGKTFEQAVPANFLPHVTRHTCKPQDRPRHADLVLHAGTAAPSSAVEFLSAALGAFVVCLPEAREYLNELITFNLETGEDLVLVDAGLASTRQVID